MEFFKLICNFSRTLLQEKLASLHNHYSLTDYKGLTYPGGREHLAFPSGRLSPLNEYH